MKRGWVVYPFLVASYPTFALYAQNADSVSLYQIAWPLALSAAAAVLVVGLLRLVLREPARAGLFSVIVFTFFYTVALAPEWVDDWLMYLSWFWVATHIHVWPPLVVAGELAVASSLAWLILKRLREPRTWTPYLNAFALILIAIPSTNTAMILAREPAKAAKPPASLVEPASEEDGLPQVRVKPPDGVETVTESGDRPDIYYIILDGYARTDVMADLFGFDNRPFLERLEQRGFYVAPRSTANYCQTPLALSSSLNSVYLNGRIPPASHDKSQLSDWIGNGAVVQTLRRLGYRFVTFATGFEETEHPEADVYLAPSPYISGFHRMLIDRTPLNWILPGESMYDEYVGAQPDAVRSRSGSASRGKQAADFYVRTYSIASPAVRLRRAW